MHALKSATELRNLLRRRTVTTRDLLEEYRPFAERTLDVDGVIRPCFEQLFWAGLSGV